jgi:hypothetical protein
VKFAAALKTSRYQLFDLPLPQREPLNRMIIGQALAGGDSRSSRRTRNSIFIAI